MVVVKPPLSATVGAVDRLVDVIVLSVTVEPRVCKYVMTSVVSGSKLVMYVSVAGEGLCIDQ